MTASSKDCDDMQQEIEQSVLDEIRRMIPEGLESDLTLDTSLYDVGLDSLARMGVVNHLEEVFAMRFSEDSLYEMETCRDLVECIEANKGAGTSQSKAPPARAAAPPSDQDAPERETAEREIRPEDYDVTQFPECVALDRRLSGAALMGLQNPFFRVNERVGEATTTIGGREAIRYTSFDYLGLAGHPQVAAAAKAAIDQFGTSSSASRLVGGNASLLEELDAELARFLGTEAAVVFPSGYGTNASVFGHLFGEDDLILYDELSHNSIVQGSLLSKARRRPFPHNDAEFVDHLLADVRGKYRRVVVAIEGIYSMDGDYPDLPRFVDVKRRHNALLFVDEAHSVGVMGPTGRGICEHFGVSPAEGDFWMGTISKALASGGGYLAGRKMLIQYLKYTTPSFVFATATSPPNAAATLAALRLLEQQPERVERLRQRCRLFRECAHQHGIETGHGEGTPVVPIILGDSARCIRVSRGLLEGGVDAQPILYPAVPENASRVRFFITAAHTEEQIRRTVDLLADCIAKSK